MVAAAMAAAAAADQQASAFRVSLFSLAFTFFVFLVTDPLRLRPIANLPFQAAPIPLSPRRLPIPADQENRLANAHLRYAGEAFGPESLAWDLDGRGPYTGVSDGRILRRSADDSGWETFAHASPYWSSEVCDPVARVQPSSFSSAVAFLSGAVEISADAANIYTRPVLNGSLDHTNYSIGPISGLLQEPDSRLAGSSSFSPVPAIDSPAKGRVGPKLATEHICGRPLGLRFHPVTGELFFADAYFGIFKVGKKGGKARVVVDRVEGRKLRFSNDVAIDADNENGTLYFTDSSTRHQRRDFVVATTEGRPDGRLVKVDLATRRVTVLLRNLVFPNGLALSEDKSFLVFCESVLFRCSRYWLKGPKEGSQEVLVDLPGSPDNVRLNPRGRFWVAMHSRRRPLIDYFAPRPWLRTLVMSLPVDIKIIYGCTIGWPHGLVVEVDADGRITDVLEDHMGRAVKAVSEVEERNGTLWIGSVVMPHVAVMKYTPRA
ncbi:hypothetical protein CLOM_g12257 [Closterium sp. NIES-68]|nr:hypothetical protein CLOM_g12257 [Closterium sp. NIES-68]GJP86627.1 hypothetical protein CLOP_g16627 [Closterium sp. NIES-67]